MDKKTATKQSVKESLPATPLTLASATMDSDDEMNSVVSSEDDFMAGPDSEDSMGEGEWFPIALVL